MKKKSAIFDTQLLVGIPHGTDMVEAITDRLIIALSGLHFWTVAF